MRVGDGEMRFLMCKQEPWDGSKNDGSNFIFEFEFPLGDICMDGQDRQDKKLDRITYPYSKIFQILLMPLALASSNTYLRTSVEFRGKHRLIRACLV